MKHTAKLLLLVMLLTLASCGEAANTDTTAASGGSTTAAPAVDPFDELESIDFGGRDFNFVGRLQYEDELCIDEATGDVLDDAVYERNQRVMEKFNVNFTWEIGTGEYSDLGKTAILAGEDTYDAIMIHSRMAFHFMAQELLHDWNVGMPYTNFDAPWWNQDLIENVVLGNKIFFMSGDISYYFLGDTHAMLFNKQVFDDLGLEYPYQTVRDGKWTYDEMKRLAAMGTFDVNGDNKIDVADDHVGYITTQWRGVNFSYIAQGTRLTTTDSDGMPILSLDTERAADIFDRVLEFMETDEAKLYGQVEDEVMMADWMSGRVMFYDGLIKYAANMRDMKDDFGFIPLPKFDEAQEHYLTTPGAGINFYTVPVTVKDTECVSAVLEGLAILGHQDIIPTYYDTVLKSKYTRDEESAEMLDLIRENIIIDFGAQIYDQTKNPLCSIGFNLVTKGENFASFYAANEGIFLDCLDEVISLIS